MPKPVKRIELSERFPVGKLILVCVLLAVGFLALTIALSSLLKSEPGWSVVEATTGESHCGSDFSFQYYLGAAEENATAERKKVSVLYTSCCEEAYRIFDPKEHFENTLNLALVNENVNHTTVVEPSLYRALEQVEKSGSRYPYLAPLTECYGSIFASQTDEEAACLDPRRNEETAEWYAEAWKLFSDPDQLKLDLLGENTVELRASAELLQWAGENDVSVYYDFFWMKNAFIADYIAERFQEAGLTAGVISSYDGFCRAFDTTGKECALSVPAEKEGLLFSAAEYVYEGPLSSVVLYGFSRGTAGEPYRYRYADGTVCTPYLSEGNGLCSTDNKTMVWLSKTSSCAELVLRILPAYNDAGSELNKTEKWNAEGILYRDGMLINTGGIRTLRDIYPGVICPNLIGEEL